MNLESNQLVRVQSLQILRFDVLGEFQADIEDTSTFPGMSARRMVQSPLCVSLPTAFATPRMTPAITRIRPMVRFKFMVFAPLRILREAQKISACFSAINLSSVRF